MGSYMSRSREAGASANSEKIIVTNQRNSGKIGTYLEMEKSNQHFPSNHTSEDAAKLHYVWPQYEPKDLLKEEEVHQILESFFSESEKEKVQTAPDHPFDGVFLWRVPLTLSQVEIIRAHPGVRNIYPEGISDYDPTEG